MGKGGPLAFLNKKTWHPGRLQNLEEVWKREQAAAKEEARLKDLQKQIAEERAKEELHQVAEAAGHRIKADRLDWMYQGGVMARQEADQRIDAQASASAAATAAAEEQPSRVDQVVKLPSFYAEDTPVAANEVWQRLHADPLFAIKQQEQAARKSIIANPVKMQAIKSQVQQLKDLAGKAEKKHKKDKKHKKEKKEKRKKRKDSSSDSEPEQPAKRHRSASPRQAQRAMPAAAEPSGRGERFSAGAAGAGREDGWGQGQRRGGDETGRRPAREDDREAARERDYGRERERGWGREYERDRGGDRDRDGARGKGEEQRVRHREHERGERDRGRGEERGGGGSRRDEEGRRRERSRERRHSRSADRGGGSRRGEEGRAHREEGGERGGVVVHIDAASAQAKGTEYGLSRGHLPAEVQRQDRSDFAEATRKRLEEAARKKEAEEREKAAQRAAARREAYRPGKLSEEERAKRLAEMASAADEHEEQRWARLKAAEEKEAAEEAEHAQRHHADTAQFLQRATKDVYGTTAGGSLEDRVGRRKFFSERRS